MAETNSPKNPSNVSDERLYTIPLRKEWLKAPKNKRAKRSARTIRAYLSRHMKVPAEGVKISGKLNDMLWVRGAARPPSKVRIKASLDAAEGRVFAILPDEKPPEAKKGKDKKESKPSMDNAKAIDDVRKAAEKATSTEEVKDAVDKAVQTGKSEEPARKEAVPEESAKPEVKNPAEKKAEPKKKPAAKAVPAKTKKANAKGN